MALNDWLLLTELDGWRASHCASVKPPSAAAAVGLLAQFSSALERAYSQPKGTAAAAALVPSSLPTGCNPRVSETMNPSRARE